MNVRSLFTGKSLSYLAGTLILMAGSQVQAADLLVPSRYPTIQAGINAAKNGDTVTVANGTYTGAGNRNLDFLGKAITVRSASDDPTKCIINCQANARGFNFHSGETSAAVVRGFTILWGNADLGGGIECLNSNPTIIRCTFDRNTAGDGGGLYGNGSNLTITDCTFTGNTSHMSAATDAGGGGICIIASRPTVSNCTFNGNTARFMGGGILNVNSDLTITGCVFNGNSANLGGGGLWIDSGDTDVTNCTFSNNSALPGGGGGIYNLGNNTSIANCNFAGNHGSTVGGGIYNNGSNASITNCAFTRNEADEDGGGIGNNGDPLTIRGCTFNENRADSQGGGIYQQSHGNMNITNSTFCANYAREQGSGVFSFVADSTITNCTFVGNLGATTLANYNCKPVITNCILLGTPGSLIDYGGYAPDAPVVTYSNVQGGWPGTGNINRDPAFVRNPSTGPDILWFSADDDLGDLRLQAVSSCIDRGNLSALPVGVTTDLAGQPRISRGKVDMGAYEYNFHTNVAPLAVNDDYTVYIGRDRDLDVLANDRDLDNDALTITSWTQPAGYNVTFDSTRKVFVVHAVPYKATFTFTYTISDGKGGTATATVTVNVRPAPVA